MLKEYKNIPYAAYNAAKAEADTALDAVDTAIAAHKVAADRVFPLLQAARAATKARTTTGEKRRFYRTLWSRP